MVNEGWNTVHMSRSHILYAYEDTDLAFHSRLTLPKSPAATTSKKGAALSLSPEQREHRLQRGQEQ